MKHLIVARQLEIFDEVLIDGEFRTIVMRSYSDGDQFITVWFKSGDPNTLNPAHMISATDLVEVRKYAKPASS